MSDFKSGFWDYYVAIISIVSILGCAVFLKMQSRVRVKLDENGQPQTTDHVWDHPDMRHVLTRAVGLDPHLVLDYASGEAMTGDEVVFGEVSDRVLLGARSLTGLNLRVDPVSKMLVDAGPAPAAVA